MSSRYTGAFDALLNRTRDGLGELGGSGVVDSDYRTRSLQPPADSAAAAGTADDDGGAHSGTANGVPFSYKP